MKTGARLTQNLVRYVVSFTAKIGIDVGMVCCYWLIFVGYIIINCIAIHNLKNNFKTINLYVGVNKYSHIYICVSLFMNSICCMFSAFLFISICLVISISFQKSILQISTRDHGMQYHSNTAINILKVTK